MKENDIILNMLANPDFTVTDFQSVGLNGDNTGLRSEEEYLQSDKIKNSEFFANPVTGEFDEARFHNFYIGAGQFYNQLATQNYEQAALDQVLFSKDDIWVSPDKRVIDYSPKLVRQENEHLVSSSLESIGKRGKRTLSQSEIAQTQKVYNTETGEWTDSPNDSFFDNFTETLVLATYDEDEYDENGKLIHQKGERKLNEEGLPYYETLGGRNVYGKQVLNKFNMLTTDGSTANQFDFFDTDGIEQKSIGGTIMRNAALVGSMFIPYVGPWITGLSVATQTAGLLATLGKLFVGNENKTLNELQGWAKTVDRHGQTEYASQNTWCVENFLNMIGDTVGQLKEQRWIFQSIPKIYGHSQAVKAMSGEKGYNAVVDDVAAQLSKKGSENTTKNLLKTLQQEGGTAANLQELEVIAANFAKQNRDKAISYVDDLIKQANNIGSPISKAYMTALTVQDTYGEARAAGASHTEAALLTIGYAAGEAAILNTELGQWILPELQSERLKFKAIAQALSKDVKDAYGTLAQDGSKKGFIQKLLNIGKNIANSNYAEKTLTGAKTLQVLGAHALTESAEEVSEELLADFSKSVFNVTRWLRGEEELELGQWDNMFDRYAMSATGGFIGGGLASAGTNFKQVRDLASMDKTTAMNEILYMVNNGTEGEFLKSLDKMNLGNKNLSASKIIKRTENGIIYAEGTQEDNQDKEIKTVVAGHVKTIKDILESEGARISTKSLLNRLTLDDQKDVMKSLRYSNLQNTKAMGLYLQEFQNIQSEIVKVKSELLELQDSKTDSGEETSIIEDRRSKLEERLKELRIKKDAFLKKDMAPEAIRDAIFEMNPIISNLFTKTNLKLYAEAKLNKKWAKLSDQEKEQITKEYKEYSETSMKNDIHTGAAILQNMIELFSPQAKRAQDFARELQKTQGQAYKKVQKHLEDILSYRLPEDVDSDEYLLKIQEKLQILDVEFAGLLGKDFFSTEVKQKLSNIAADTTLDAITRARLYTNTIFDNLADNLEKNVEDFIKLQYIHPEVKNSLLHTMTTARDALQAYAQNMDADDPTSYAYDIENDPTINFADKMDAIDAKFNDLLSKVDKIDSLIPKIQSLSNTPIYEYLNQFQVSVTTSDLNLTQHLKKVNDLLQDATDNNSLDELLIGDFQEDNEEALLLLDSFITVINSMKIDNADINNPTGFSKMLNEVYSKQGVKNYVPLTELSSDVADIMLQDALLIKKKLEFVQDIHNINSGQKLRQHDKVNTNKHFLLFNNLQKRFVNVLPDDWIGDDSGTSAKQVLQSVIDSSKNLLALKQDDLKTTKELRDSLEEEMTILSNTIYDIFNRNKVGSSWKTEDLEKILKGFAGLNGFFQKTGDVLNDSTKVLDDNSFIWWLATKAILRQSDYDLVYTKALSEDLAPIPSQELAVQLGIGAITNMDALNAFVDAYRNTVIKEFNGTSSKAERERLLKQFDENSTGFADELLKYFASYDALPQYHNMVFIEGIPGSGKSGGVFKIIKAVMDQIDPEWLKGSIYAHVTQKSAEKAGGEGGLNLEGAQYHDKASLMRYMSADWKDVLKNPDNKDGKVYLYKDSYEFDANGKLQNKWKVNKVSDAPKVIFIDEISHYNQQELSLIEQFAKLNGTVVLTAGDLDQDTLTTYFEEGGKEFNVTINRNNFIRSPKLGLSLRTLNKQMTHDVTMMQAAMQNIKEGKSVSALQFTYLEDDPNHKGLFGVKTASTLNDDVKRTIQTMVDTATGKIGYIYHSKDTDLYKYLEENFKDKIEFYKDSEAQGLEGQYYIVENAIVSTGTSISNAQSYQYARSLYTGISRAEQGVLAIVPDSRYGLIESVHSVKDPTYQLENIGKEAIKKSSNNRKTQLEKLTAKFAGNPITIVPPSVTTSTTSSTSTTSTTPLPPPLPPSTPPITKIDYGFIDQREAIRVANDFNTLIGTLTKPIAINNGTGDEYKIHGPATVQTTTLTSGETVHTPIIKLEDGSGILIEVPVEQVQAEYTIKDKDSGLIAPDHSIGDTLYIDESGAVTEIRITNVEYLSGDLEPTYTVVNEEDGSNERKILQRNFIQTLPPPPAAPSSASPSKALGDTGLENMVEALAGILTENNETEEYNILEGDHISHRLYTFNAFQPGIKFSGGRLIYNDKRIDNGVGLLKAWGYDPRRDDAATYYNRVIDTLGYIKRKLYHETDNSEVLRYLVEDVLKVSGGNYKMLYAFKSSDPKLSGGYEQYYSEKGELDYIYSEDPKAKDPQHKKLVLLVKDGDKTIFELNVASLNSPLTLLQQKNDEGVFIYGELGSRFEELIKIKTENDALDQIINEFNGKVHENFKQDLINLIKFYKFTSNGIFYLGTFEKDDTFTPSDFNLAKCKSSGPQLIKERGSSQRNGGLQYNGGYISLEKFSKNPQFTVSSIMASRDNTNTSVKTGYPFVLVSTDPKIISDDDLICQFEAKNPNVRMYYVLPPRAKASEWLMSQHKNYEAISKNATVRVRALIGNQFTVYRVLDALIKNGNLNDPAFADQSPGSLKDNIIKAVQDLNNIAEKWQKDTIEFSEEIIDSGKKDSEVYEECLAIYEGHSKAEELARERAATLEQRKYLESKNTWGKAPITADMSVQDGLNHYLRELIWTTTPTVKTDETKLAIIDKACEKQGLEGILYKTFIGKSIGEHSEYVKVITDTKYGIRGIDGTIKDFEINAKIDPPSFSSEILWQYISQFTATKEPWNSFGPTGNSTHRTGYFYYDSRSKTWKLTSNRSGRFEQDYLSKKGIFSPTETIKSKIVSKYNRYFTLGLLNEAIIDFSKDEITNLKNLATEYNKIAGNYGFVYNGVLYLSTYDSDITIDSVPNTLVDKLTGKDSSGNEYTFNINKVEEGGFIKELQIQRTVYRPYVVAPTNPDSITDRDVADLLQAINEYNRGKRPTARICGYLTGIADSTDLITWAINIRDTNDLITRIAIESDLELLENNPILTKVLKYIKGEGNLENNEYNIIVKVGNDRMLLLNDSQAQILQDEEYPSEFISERPVIDLSDSQRRNMKIEEVECHPIVWNLK